MPIVHNSASRFVFRLFFTEVSLSDLLSIVFMAHLFHMWVFVGFSRVFLAVIVGFYGLFVAVNVGICVYYLWVIDGLLWVCCGFFVGCCGSVVGLLWDCCGLLWVFCGLLWVFCGL